MVFDDIRSIRRFVLTITHRDAQQKAVTGRLDHDYHERNLAPHTDHRLGLWF